MRKKDTLMFKCEGCHYVYPTTMDKCPVCGKSAEALTPQPVSKLESYKTINMRGSKCTEADFIMSIKGRGMVPYVDDGQSVYVKKTSDIKPGDVCLVELDDGRIVIRYLSEEGLVSLSPSWENFHVDPKASYTPIGKVIGVVQPQDYVKEPGDEIKCSFCGRTEDEANTLFSASNGVVICDMCITACTKILKKNVAKMMQNQENGE